MWSVVCLSSDAGLVSSSTEVPTDMLPRHQVVMFPQQQKLTKRQWLRALETLMSFCPKQNRSATTAKVDLGF